MTYTDKSIMPFGKYRGKALANIPAEYLIWLEANIKKLDGGLKTYIRDNMEVLKSEVEKPKESQ